MLVHFSSSKGFFLNFNVKIIFFFFLLIRFPNDTVAQKVDRAFLWGSGLYIIPVLEQGATSVNAYLPNARWFDLKTGLEIIGTDVTLDAPYDTIPLLLRGGSIIPTQDPAVTTTLR